MKTAEKNQATVQGTGAKVEETANSIPNRPSLTGKEAKNDEGINKGTTAQAAQVEKGKANDAKVGGPVTVDNKPADSAAYPFEQDVKDKSKAEPLKAEEAQAGNVKVALNLEQTLKSVADLHRLSLQRLALIARIRTLEDFEVKLQEEGDELESNPYEGCKLIIEDDKRRQFITRTPNLIRMVAQFIFDACHNKLAEIEANIVFPNA